MKRGSSRSRRREKQREARVYTGEAQVTTEGVSPPTGEVVTGEVVVTLARETLRDGDKMSYLN